MEIFNLEFLEPIYFLLIFLVPVLIYFIYKKQKDSRKFLFFIDLKNTYKRNSLVFYLKIALLTLIIVFYAIIFANPHKIEIKTENAPSIVFALDVSYSMETADVGMKRIDLAKKFLNEFLEKQRENKAGLILFAGKAFVSIPLTFDYDVLSEVLENLSTNTDKSLDGTAIGDAIIMASNLSPDMIILLTDGDINAGTPLETAIIEAKNKGIKIYTIGIGGEEKTELSDWSGTYEIAPLNEEILREIAMETGGEYFRNTFPTFLIGAEKRKGEDRVNEFFVFSLLGVLFLYLILVLWKPQI